MPTVLITGGHKGLGLESVRHIARRGGFDIVLGGRNRTELDAAVSDLKSRYSVNIHAVDMDVSSLTSVRAGAAAVKVLIASGKVGPLQVLLLNAGAQFAGDVQYSLDGFELTFATNCIGHFLLLNLLLDEIVSDGRVVFTASGTHDPLTRDGKMVGAAAAPDAQVLANQGKNGKSLPYGTRYSTSKLCTILYAYELNRRLRAADSHIASIAFDPGLIVETGLIRSAPAFAQRMMRTGAVKALFKAMGVTMGSIPFSGKSLADIAVGDDFADVTGEYIQSKDGVLSETRSSEASYDLSSATKLWSDTEKLVGLTSGDRPALLQRT